MKKELSALQKQFQTADALIAVLEENSFSVKGLFAAHEDTSQLGCEVVLQRLLGSGIHDPGMSNELIFMKQQDKSLTRALVNTSISNQTAELAKFVSSPDYQKNAIDSTVKSFFHLLSYDAHDCMCALRPTHVCACQHVLHSHACHPPPPWLQASAARGRQRRRSTSGARGGGRRGAALLDVQGTCTRGEATPIYLRGRDQEAGSIGRAAILALATRIQDHWDHCTHSAGVGCKRSERAVTNRSCSR